jgi:hypothetical protein
MPFVLQLKTEVIVLRRRVLGIPAKLNSIPEGSRTLFRAEGEHRRSEATLAL